MFSFPIVKFHSSGQKVLRASLINFVPMAAELAAMLNAEKTLGKTYHDTLCLPSKFA